MRQTQASSNGDFNARAIAGTHTVLIALNCKDPRRKDLKGFAFQREVVGAGRHRPEMAALAEGLQVGRARSHERPRSRRSDQAGALLYQRLPDPEFPVGRLWLAARARNTASASSRCTARPARSPPMRRMRSTSRSRPRRNGPRARPTACGSTAAPSPARSSPRNSATRRRRTSTTRPIRKSNGCRAACSKPAWNTSTRPSRAMRCGSPPMNSPIRRFSTPSRRCSTRASTCKSSTTTRPTPGSPTKQR